MCSTRYNIEIKDVYYARIGTIIESNPHFRLAVVCYPSLGAILRRHLAQIFLVLCSNSSIQKNRTSFANLSVVKKCNNQILMTKLEHV